MKKIYQRIFSLPQRVFYCILIIPVFILIIGGFLYLKKEEYLIPTSSKERPLIESFQENQSFKASNEKISETSDSLIYVDVKGAVNRPGMYSFSIKDRVFDVIKKAGGLTEFADEKRINLASKLTDQQLLYVPTVGEELSNEQILNTNELTATELSKKKVDKEKINLNTAELSQLQEIPGIGEKKAQEIIQYRKEHGSFKNVEELQEISGIGEKTVEKIKNFITIAIE
ncbi:helix-hairpin-helix domain-containing protein [Enterococcus ratti]|uniref:ComEA protein n=1 Tax=Enterococcus ratti TaxID=150033 RepID=A0A1L8WB30_9ENTE|nr:helix-hairpin-helix domain-containing protein [Enterococcus ratti]OJG78253.1 comEA protein [Enterococcus ratti]